ncbi:MAG: phospho-sugar mutase [Clostridiales bacterium]|nr:phospho-sugar mutase [Clostridiales bacterium]MBP3809905.1 phospho-sugar mutase [Clostridiales bacterium]
MSAADIYKIWSTDPFFDETTRNELLAIADNSTEIEDRFYKDLEFGTGGLRGIIGAGTNRINAYTVAKASAGLADYIVSNGEEAKERGVVICHDSRHFSPEFAQVAAQVFANAGIRVYLTDELRPVPMCSFSVRYFNAFAGVMITASHNPPKYNGYKVYGEDGGQVTEAAAAAILQNMEKYADVRTTKMADFDEALAAGTIKRFGPEVDIAYTDMLKELVIDAEAIKRQANISVVYTPLHGSGNKPVRRILKSIGLNNVYVVPQQELPDGAFPTVKTPNPEDPAALSMGIELAKKVGADLVFGTDPDSDRLGIAVRTKDGEYKALTGNQVGLMLLDYILDSKKKLGTLEDNSFACTTIVSTKLCKAVCEAYGVELQETLTGFKYIGERIKVDDEFGNKHFQFGFEESYGYLSGTSVRDKDAVVAAMLVCGMACQSQDMGETLIDRLYRIYNKYGYGFEQAVSFTREGKEGLEKIRNGMASMRAELEACKTAEDAAKLIGGPKPVAVRDYQKGIRYDFSEGTVKTSELTLPKSNVLLYELGGDKGLDWACARPSGTEPKLKIYFGVYDKDEKTAADRLESIKGQMSAFVENKLG